MVKEALGSGLLPDEFYEMSLDEYILRREGLHERRRKELRETFQPIRLLTYHIILSNPFISLSEKRKPFHQLVPDIYDDKPMVKISLKDRYKNLLSRYERAGVIKDGIIIQPTKSQVSGK